MFGDAPPVDQRRVAHGRGLQANAEQHFERAAVPAEGELVGMGLEVGAAEAVTDAERQPLEVGVNMVDSPQQHVRRHDAGRLW